jgi:hypothetical protein
MQQIAGTMPEQKFRSTKKRVQPNHPLKQTSTAAQALPAVAKKEKAKAEKKQSGIGLASWWPVAVGLFLCGFTPEWMAMMQQAGVWAVRFTFPLALLATHKDIGISDHWAPMMPQIALYAQLPLEGLLTKLTLSSGRSLKAAIVQLILVHAVAAFVLWLLTFGMK